MFFFPKYKKSCKEILNLVVSFVVDNGTDVVILNLSCVFVEKEY